ncbi:MAG: sulfatase [Sphingobacteriales bacterium]|nr:sulfatase [Sphingobacteriales bacterium]
MLKSFVVLLRFLFFWMVFFLIDRIVFLLYFREKLRGTNLFEVATTFLYSLRLDASMAGYVSVLPLLTFIIFWFFKRSPIPSKVLKYYVNALIIIFSLISIFNFNIYREWGSKINFKALDFAINTPNEAIASSTSSPIMFSLLVFAILVVANVLLAKKVIEYKMPRNTIPAFIKGGLSILLLGIAFLLIRGGWQLSPINQSMAYFSTKPILNHAAVNTEWNFIQDILNNKNGGGNPYSYFKPEEAREIVAELYQDNLPDTQNILTTNRPNIVFIILESFTSDLIESLGGEKGITPNLENLISKGVLFNNIYSTGGRTDKGIIGALSGFPSQAIKSIINQNDKQEKLPSIARSLTKSGYSTSFYYGGESEFFNLKSYVFSHDYQKLVDEHSFASKDMNSKWGTYDGQVFQKNATDLAKFKQPFFSTILTLTNHEPFELPVKAHFKGDNVENKFRSTAYYTDSCIGSYIKSLEKQPVYKNTLFLIVADHGHRLPKNESENFHPRRYSIPLILFGDVIKPEYRGKKFSKIGNQTDIAATLLNQLQMSSSEYKWSKDLFNPSSKEFSFFNWDNGFGFVTNTQMVSFDNIGKQIIYEKNPTDVVSKNENLRYGKAYMQEVHQQYLDY